MLDFVKRLVKYVNIDCKPREDGKSSNLPSPLFKIDSQYCRDTKWLRRFYLLLGMLPISKSITGRMQFKFISLTMLYSVSIYFILSSICISFFLDRLYKLMTLFGDFDSFIYNFMFLSFVKTQYFYSIGGWLAAKQIVVYHNMWIDFETLYAKKLKQPLVMEQLEQMTYRVVGLWIMGTFSLIFGQFFTLPTYTLQECFGYFPSTNSTFLYVALMWINSYAIRMASGQLLKNLIKDLQRNPVTQDIIINYKILWLSLSNITQYFGVAFFNYSIVILLGTFIDLTISGYGCLSRLLANLKSTNESPIISLEELGLTVATVISVVVITFVSNSTHFVTAEVETTFIDELCMAATRRHHPKVIKEIDEFLMAIKHNPPVISLGGYINLDRKFITKVLTTIVTYWVVLMQFKVGFSKTAESHP